MMIPSVFDDAKIGDVLSLLTEIYDYNDGGNGSNSRYSKLNSFSINNRLCHFGQSTKAVMMIQSIFNDVRIGDILRY